MCSERVLFSACLPSSNTVSCAQVPANVVDTRNGLARVHASPCQGDADERVHLFLRFDTTV
jgi:hypothetical protein